MASWPSGKARVCKTLIPRFESGWRLFPFLVSRQSGQAVAGVRLLALAKVERLLARRTEMQRAYLQLASRPPRDVRRRQLGQELGRNAGETRGAVRELIGDLQVISSRKVAYQ